MPVIQFKRLYSDVEMPHYATVGGAGCALKIHSIKEIQKANDGARRIASKREGQVTSITLEPGDNIVVGFGFAVAIPDFYMLDIQPGVHLPLGATITALPSVIDCTYRSEVEANIYNKTDRCIYFIKGMKVGLGVITEFDVAIFNEVIELPAYKQMVYHREIV